MDKGPIFILGCSKSGTSLLRNLFDGHPDFFVIPAESHFFQNIGYWVNYYTRRARPRKLCFEEMKKELLRWIDYSNLQENTLADGFTAGKWNLDNFKATLTSKKVSSLRDLSDLYIASMYASVYNKPIKEELRFIEKSVENAEFAFDWLRLYPNAKFIHILRNPYSNIVAFRKFYDPKKFTSLKAVIYSMYNSYYFLYKNSGLINEDQYKIVIYEDLIKNPEKTMKDLSDFAEIQFSDILLAPTILGKPWSGNSTSGVSFSGISAINVEKWKKEISSFEIGVVNELFAHVVEDFGFERIKSKKSLMRFAKGENISDYIENRWFYYNMPRFGKDRKAKRHQVAF